MEKTKKLYRSKTDKIIAGVCGGLAEYFEMDSTIIRVIFVILAFFSGIGILLYIILAIIVPENPMQIPETTKEKKIENNIKSAASDIKENIKSNPVPNYKGEQIFGLIILLIGLVYTINIFVPWLSLGKLWPLLLIGIGLVLILRTNRKG